MEDRYWRQRTEIIVVQYSGKGVHNFIDENLTVVAFYNSTELNNGGRGGEGEGKRRRE